MTKLIAAVRGVESSVNGSFLTELQTMRQAFHPRKLSGTENHISHSMSSAAAGAPGGTRTLYGSKLVVWPKVVSAVVASCGLAGTLWYLHTKKRIFGTGTCVLSNTKLSVGPKAAVITLV